MTLASFYAANDDRENSMILYKRVLEIDPTFEPAIKLSGFPDDKLK
jgi:hypothetical protein